MISNISYRDTTTTSKTIARLMSAIRENANTDSQRVIDEIRALDTVLGLVHSLTLDYKREADTLGVKPTEL